MKNSIWFLLAAGIFLAGCETTPSLERVSDLRIDLRDRKVSFVLRQEVTVPAGRARLFLQNGGVVGSRNLYQPHCILEIDSVDHQGFAVSAEAFEVMRIQRSTVQIATQGELRLASSLVASGALRNRSASRLHDGYHFWLQSDAQPAVMRLTCYGVFERPSHVRTPTLEEIGVALGEVGSLQVR